MLRSHRIDRGIVERSETSRRKMTMSAITLNTLSDCRPTAVLFQIRRLTAQRFRISERSISQLIESGKPKARNRTTIIAYASKCTVY